MTREMITLAEAAKLIKRHPSALMIWFRKGLDPEIDFYFTEERVENRKVRLLDKDGFLAWFDRHNRKPVLFGDLTKPIKLKTRKVSPGDVFVWEKPEMPVILREDYS